MFGASVGSKMGESKLSKLTGYDYPFNLSEAKLRDLNFEFLKGFTRYLTQQQREGQINDKEFSFLMNHLGSKFIENEIEIKFNKILNTVF